MRPHAFPCRGYLKRARYLLETLVRRALDVSATRNRHRPGCSCPLTETLTARTRSRPAHTLRPLPVEERTSLATREALEDTALAQHNEAPTRIRLAEGRGAQRRGHKAGRSQVRAQQCVLLAGRLDCRRGGFASHGTSLSLCRYVECGRRAPFSPGFRADTEEESRESLLAAPRS